MNKNHWLTTARNGLHRALAGLLCLVLLLGLMPGLTLSASAETTENWATPYLNQLVGWGVMRGDINGNLHPERNITRAEFVTMMNRAYGYDKVAGNPFTDVYPSDWFYDDIDIAYNVGYFNGTSPTTASPRGELTREQAAVLLGRNMMLQGASGETLGFTDSRDLSSWSRGLVGAAAQAGVIGGYGDGSFRPKNSITRGEVAAMLARAVGSLINQPGSQSLGSVYGNLTINSSEVSLRNTAVVGNLYLTGGIGLGDVLLENVDVYGEIIVAGAGEANSSESSVIMRNVTANEMIVDNISNQFVTVRAEGDTRIAKTSVRTNAYVEDTTPNGYGLSYIELDGEQGTKLQLAGNIKEVKNLTPMSSLEIVQGSASKVTSDEHATGSGVKIDGGARVDELNLDVGANVSGSGDIGTMNVGAAGTNVGILPDNITVRPGITSNITGTSMNNVTAAESSADPRLLSGYPAVRNVGPNSATLVFSTNKAGTVYWAVSALADGSVSEDDLITNPTYGGGIFRSGKINAASSKTEYTAQVSGLTVDGSYYVSAVLVDSRGNHSPLKVTAFSTPDNTTPAFTTGYPVITRNTTKTAQVTVMTNKSCQMYYALLPRGASTPTAKELKSGSVSGNLGYGVVDVVKNSTQPVNVNRNPLDEQTNYTLYLWLNDYDNARSSGVRSVQFTTPDETPPVVTDIMQTNSAAASVDVTYMLNEPGTLYWAVVVGDNETFMNYDDLSSTEAKIKTEAGSGALKKGSSSASKADTAIRLAITGLNSKTTGTTSYDVYYIAKDRAGNYAATVGKINVRTLDNEAPTVTQEFTKYNDDKKDEPLADTDIRLVFSESVQGGSKGEKEFLKLYEAVTKAKENEIEDARKNLADALRQHIKMYRVPAGERPDQVTERTKDDQDDWTIDYRYAQVTTEEGKMVITFPTTAKVKDREVHGLNLESGATYYFRVEGIYDTALTPNAMGGKDLDWFTTVVARVFLSPGDNYTLDMKEDIPDTVDKSDSNNIPTRMDFNFVMDPISVDRVDENMRWDMLIWSDTTISFTIYERVEGGKWEKVNTDTGPDGTNKPAEITVSDNDEGHVAFTSLTKVIRNNSAQATEFPRVKTQMKKTEYAIHVDSIGGNKDFTSWNYNVNMRISIVAGAKDVVDILSKGSFLKDYREAEKDGALFISTPDPFQRRLFFTDSKPPKIEDGWPTITVSDTRATINVMLDRPGMVYYLVLPLSQLNKGAIDNNNVKLDEETIGKIESYSTKVKVEGGSVTDIYSEDGQIKFNDIPVGNGVVPKVSYVPRIGVTNDGVYRPTGPTVNTVTTIKPAEGIISGTTNNVSSGVAATINLTGLSPNTVYYVCLVTRGTAAIYADSAVCYRFTTTEAQRPTIEISGSGSVATIELKNDRDADINYFLALNGDEGDRFSKDYFKDSADEARWEDVDEDGSGTNYRFTDGSINFQFSKSKDQMKVIDAMAIPCYDGGTYMGSVFDVYASTSAKNTYGSLIRSSSVSGNKIVMTGSAKLKAADNGTTRNQIECKDKMNLGVLYTFVAVGKTPGGSGDAFRAYYTLTKKDETPPMVTSIFFTGSIDGKGKTGTFHEGSTLTVNFSEQLYTPVKGTDGQIAIPFDDCANGTHSAGINRSYKAIGDLAMAPIGYSIKTAADHKTANKDIRQLVFNLGQTSGASIAFPTGALCDEYRNGLSEMVNGKEVPKDGLSIQIKIIVIDETKVKNEDGTESIEYTYGVRLEQLTPSWRSSGFITNLER